MVLVRDRLHNCLLLTVSSLLIFSTLGVAAECPPPPSNHIPTAPTSELNLDAVKNQLIEYHRKYYNQDIEGTFELARKFVEQTADPTKRPALVLDIDETSLTNWPNLVADNLGFIPNGPCNDLPLGPCGFNDWILKASADAIEPARKLFIAAKTKGVAVIFITGRRDRQRDATLLNLDHAGFDGWTELRTRPDRDEFSTVQAFKSLERSKVEAEGYTIIANVGDQDSDLAGGHSLCIFKVPNPFYFIP